MTVDANGNFYVFDLEKSGRVEIVDIDVDIIDYESGLHRLGGTIYTNLKDFINSKS